MEYVNERSGEESTSSLRQFVEAKLILVDSTHEKFEEKTLKNFERANSARKDVNDYAKKIEANLNEFKNLC